MKCKLKIQCNDVSICWLETKIHDQLIIRAGQATTRIKVKIKTKADVACQALKVLDRWAKQGRAEGPDLAQLQLVLMDLCS